MERDSAGGSPLPLGGRSDPGRRLSPPLGHAALPASDSFLFKGRRHRTGSSRRIEAGTSPSRVAMAPFRSGVMPPLRTTVAPASGMLPAVLRTLFHRAGVIPVQTGN